MISGLLALVVELLLLLAATTTHQPAAASHPSLRTQYSGQSPAGPPPMRPEIILNNNITLAPHDDFQTRASLQSIDSDQINAEDGALQSPSPNAPTRNKSSTIRNSYKNRGHQPIFTNQFVIEVKGGEEEARKLAYKHGFVYLNHILGDFYHLEHKRLSKRSLSSSLKEENLDISIQDEPQVLLVERQVLKRRVKRDFLDLAELSPQQAAFGRSGQGSGFRLGGGWQAGPASQRGQQRPSAQPSAWPAHHQFTRPANQAPNYSLRGPARPLARPPPAASGQLELARQGGQELLEAAASSSGGLVQSQPQPQQQQVVASPERNQPALKRPSSAPAAALNASPGQQLSPANLTDRPFNDPSWPLMWYLDGGAKNGFDLNVMAAWKMGYTGKGIVITILDDGLEKDHPDLQANYDPLASFDINNDDADPMPRYDANDSNRHGTRCAGEVAAVPDNNICSIGIAYNSKVGGVRMLDGDVTDAVEARSLSLNNQHIHIYSASWGPDDNGKTVDGPGDLATRAFIEGVTNGRQGLGSIFVFASGNGGREHDNCNCDGYTNSIWTLSISSATENGYVPWYIESCSSTLATTYSSGSYEERQIATTDLHHTCTSSHTGTSASAPLAAGICALVLESNPRLSWRDMQHIVVKTAKPANLIAKDWRTNALGRNVSHAFGYGLMDAAAMILMARKWTTVPKQYTCEVRSPQMDLLIRPKGYVELKLRAECANVRFLEHVQSKVTLTAQRRGDLHIYLISPHGTRSTLLAQRPNDVAEQGFRNWPFMTVHSWGESPNGNWTLEVHNDGKPQNKAYLKEMTLILYGTYEDPNRHLVDLGASPAQAAARTQPAPPRPSQKPSPPAPLPEVVAQQPAPAAPQQEAGRPAWVVPPPAPMATPPPRPLAPVTPTPGPPTTTFSSSSSSASATSSSSSSLVTTFKSVLNGSAVSESPLGALANQSQSGHQPKADFDVVSAQEPERPSPTQLHEQQTTPAPQDAPLPNIQHSSPTKPPVSAEVTPAQSPSTEPAGEQTKEPVEATRQQFPAELETNQLDLKLSKDYRSSGDHFLAAAAEESSGDEESFQAGKRPQADAASAGARLTLNGQQVFLNSLANLLWLLLPLVRAR